MNELHAEVVAKQDASQAPSSGMGMASPADSTETPMRARHISKSVDNKSEQQDSVKNSPDVMTQATMGVVDRLDRWGFWGLAGF